MITAICLTPALKERNRALRRRKPLGEFVFEGKWGEGWQVIRFRG